MIGAIAGDIIGSIYEAQNYKGEPLGNLRINQMGDGIYAITIHEFGGGWAVEKFNLGSILEIVKKKATSKLNDLLSAA